MFAGGSAAKKMSRFIKCLKLCEGVVEIVEQGFWMLCAGC